MIIIPKQNPFKKIIPQDSILKNLSVAFQQAMECIIENKEELAASFKDEMEAQKKEMDEYASTICFSTPSTTNPLYYIYIQHEIQIAEKLMSVLDWILAKKSSIGSGPIETELFVLADSAAETIDKLTSLSKELSKAFKKFSGLKSKPALQKKIDEIKLKSKKTFDLSLRMKSKILESETDNASAIHLVLLADMIGQVAEKTRDTAWIATSLCC